MTETLPIPLVGLILTDKFSGEILLLHRRDHMQWQIPGGRIEPQDSPHSPVSPAVTAAQRHAQEELGIEIYEEEKLQFLGSAGFRQWGKKYDCQYYELKTSIDLAACNDPVIYDAMAPHNLFRMNTIRSPEYSANVVQFAGKLAAGEILLTF